MFLLNKAKNVGGEKGSGFRVQGSTVKKGYEVLKVPIKKRPSNL